MIKPELIIALGKEMEACPQFEGMSVWEHGRNVHEWYMDLFQPEWYGLSRTKSWRLPDWINHLIFRDNAFHIGILEEYQIWHDIGKPRCKVIDEEGKVHFPNHAEVSKLLYWESSEQTEDDLVVAELIGMDMLAHTVKGEEREEFSKHPYAPSLLLTALAEIHSNASHLGRLDSDGFKIKAKQLDKVAKLIIKNRSV